MSENIVRQYGTTPEHLVVSWTKFNLIEGWSLYKNKYFKHWHIVFHDECFDHFSSKWPRARMTSSNINKRSVSCPYCKLKSSREVMKRIKFILGIV